MFAMPETSIGLFPDVGGGWHLSRLLGRLPQFLALTGARLDGAECFALGLATHYVAHEDVDQLKADIARDPDRIDAYLAHAQAAPPPARIKANRDKICRLFAAETLEGIMADLEADGSDWALTELATLRGKSPTACKVSLRLLDRGRADARFCRRDGDGICVDGACLPPSRFRRRGARFAGRQGQCAATGSPPHPKRSPKR